MQDIWKLYQEQKISTPFSVYMYNKSAMHTLQLIQSDTDENSRISVLKIYLAFFIRMLVTRQKQYTIAKV